MSDDWISVFNATTTREELEAAIEQWALSSIEDLRVRLAADGDLSPLQREVMLARLLPVARDTTRQAFEAAWDDLQREAAAEREGQDTVH